MTAEFLEVEVKQEIVNIPRENVAKVIWLHDRQWESEETAKESEKQENDEGQIAENAAEERAEDVATSNVPFRIHAIRRGDRGLTFVPSGCDGKMLAGASELLGECNVEIEEVDQLLFGRDITARVREYREDPWVLALAQYPRVFLEDEGGAADPSAGKNSEFVGKSAPKFGLAQLDGEHFRLTDHRDRIVVLDFWASWCGPCMQTMPKVDEIVEEIGTDKVHLVAVNLQEPAARVEAALAKLNIAPTVLLDVDGEVAAAYGASAIPQTVIIDKQGVVQHLFVGGGNRFVTNFRAALEELTAETNVAQ
jgi:thiol-disulfide isomerase/thioredoxin